MKEKNTKKFKFLEHTADVKFRAYGKNLNELFENSALALVDSQYKGKIKPVKRKKIIVKSKKGDLENLMYRFLEEILFLIDSKGFLVSEIKVKINKEKNKIQAELIGDDIKNYKISIDLKAVTYNEMFVKQEKDKKSWVAQVVLDV